MIRLRARAYSQLITPDHKIPFLREYRGRKFIASCDARDLSPTRTQKLPIAGLYSGDDAVPLVIARLYAAVQADAWIRPDYSTEFHFRKRRKISRLRALLTQAGCIWKEYRRSDGTVTMSTKDLEPIASQLGRSRRYGRWLLDWSGPALDAWLDELKHWDGTYVERYL